MNHRPTDTPCSEPAPPGNCDIPNSAFPGSCATDDDCADAGSDGRCIDPHIGGPALCYCTHDACAADADCGTAQTCACRGAPYTHGGGNACVPENCRIDSDCGAGGYCSPSVAPNSLSLGGYYCHTAHDECIDDSDCPTAGPGSPPTLAFCAYSTMLGHWACQVIPEPI